MKDDFQLFPDAGHRDPPVDPDISLISAYLAGELSLVQIAAVEDRLSGDRAFRSKVQPIIEAWMQPVSFAPGATRLRSPAHSDNSLSAAEVEAGWQRIANDAAVVPARPRLVAAQDQSRNTSRRKSMTRAASIIAVIALPLAGLAQAAVYAAKHKEAPGHAVAQRIVAPFVQTAPDAPIDGRQTPNITPAEERVARQLQTPRESALIVATPTTRSEPIATAPAIAPELPQPDRAQVSVLASQHQSAVTRGTVEASYIVMVFDTKGQYKWSTHGKGGLHVQVAGDTRTFAERQAYVKYGAEFRADTTSYRAVVGDSQVQVVGMRVASVDTTADRLKRNQSIASRPPYAIARLYSVDTLRGSPHAGYRAGWNATPHIVVDGKPVENLGEGLEVAGDGRSGILGLPATSVARTDIYVFRPGELAPRELRIMAVYLTQGSTWKSF